MTLQYLRTRLAERRCSSVNFTPLRLPRTSVLAERRRLSVLLFLLGGAFPAHTP